MLAITIPAVEAFDETTSTVIETEAVTIELEHSLASISKWESEFEKPFLGPEARTSAEVVGYIRCMCLTPGVHPSVFRRLSAQNYEDINAYINRKMTATWFNERKEQGRGREIVTAEVIYFWMAHYNIPFEADQWHFNRLITLIRVANNKNDSSKSNKPKRVGRAEQLAQRRALNEQRKKQFGTTG